MSLFIVVHIKFFFIYFVLFLILKFIICWKYVVKNNNNKKYKYNLNSICA